MKVKYIGSRFESPLCLIKNKIYECISIENKWYRIIDESGEDYLFPPEEFEILE